MRLRSCGPSPTPSAQSQARWPSLGCWAKAISSCRFRARNAVSTLRRMPAPWISNSATTTWLAWRPHYALKPCPDRATTKESWRGLIAEGSVTVAEPFGGNGDCSPAYMGHKDLLVTHTLYRQRDYPEAHDAAS